MIRKHVGCSLLCAALAVTLTLSPALAAAAPPSAAASAESASFASDLESRYRDPDRKYQSDVRWWLGEASNTDEALLEEIQALYDGGFHGVELCMQENPLALDKE